MSTNLSRRAFLGTTGLMAASLAACGGNGGNGGEGGEGGDAAATGSVYWLNFKPELDETVQSLATKYTETTGVPVKAVTAASGTYQQTLLSEMDKTDAPTLFIIGNAAGVKEWGDYAMDLKGTAIESELSTDAYNLYDESGKLVSMGYCYECYGIVANADLIAKAGHDIADIKDFESLKAVAEDIHARAAELGFDAFVATDMDGTFLTEEHVLPQANIDAVLRMRELGVLFVPASGRPMPSILYTIRDLPPEALEGSYVLSYNGGVVHKIGNPEPLYANTLPIEVVDRIFQWGLTQDVGFHVYETGGKVWLDTSSRSVREHYARSWEETPDDIEHVFIVTIEDGEITMVSEEGEPTIDELMSEAMTVPESGVTESEAL